MEASTACVPMVHTPRTRKSSLTHRLGLILGSLTRGDLQHRPHHRAALIRELQFAARDLGTLATACQDAATEMSDAQTMIRRMRAADHVADSLESVLAALSDLDRGRERAAEVARKLDHAHAVLGD